MSGYTSVRKNSLWNLQTVEVQTNPYHSEHNMLQSQQFDFQSFGDGQDINEFHEENLENCLDQDNVSDSSEPTLLEELEIYPDQIIQKIIAVLNPIHNYSKTDDADFLTLGTDLAGPLFFCVILAVSLLISGSKIYFGYIYGLSVVCCIIMYCLLFLITNSTNVLTLAGVSSILGYSLLPIVAMSILGIFISFHNSIGIMIAVAAVLWSTLSASRLFTAVLEDKHQRPLIAYPCLLACGTFALLVIF